VLLKASTLGAQKARAMRSATGAFDIDDFVAKLITFMGGRNPLEDRVLDDSDDSDAEVDEVEYPLDWEKIGRRALAKSRRVPTMDFMYACFESMSFAFLKNGYTLRLGPLSIEQKKRTQNKRTRLEKDKEVEQKPQELQNEDISRSENETSKNVKNVFPSVFLCAHPTYVHNKLVTANTGKSWQTREPVRVRY
jgi:non-structural maintenance of chromosomes element 4